jgi:shikimate dehydrogenase
MKRFYLIGHSLNHSFSPAYFNQKFDKEALSDCRYEILPLSSLSGFRDWALSQDDLVGINVTVPFKIQIIPFLDELDPTASGVSAVNTILKKGHKLIGFNTDVTGFKQSLLNTNRQDRHALVLGSGGASKAVCFVLDELEIGFTLVSRERTTAGIGYSDLTPMHMNQITLIINCTPLGMFPDVLRYPDILYQYLTEKHFCYDLIYNPEETAFMKMAQVQGAQVKNGYEMLVFQAEAAWDIWMKTN